MKSPICEICLKSGLLCTACQEKVVKGKISSKEIEILNLLYKESQKNKLLSDVEIKKIIERPDLVLIVCSAGNTAKIVGKGGVFVKRLQDAIKKPVRIVEGSEDPRKFLQNILFPVPIINLNVLYTSKGEKYRIVIPERSRLPMPIKTLTSLAEDLFGKEVEIAFESSGKEETTEEKIRRLVKKIK